MAGWAFLLKIDQHFLLLALALALALLLPPPASHLVAGWAFLFKIDQHLPGGIDQREPTNVRHQAEANDLDREDFIAKMSLLI